MVIKIRVNYKDDKELIRLYISLITYELKLPDKELQVLVELVYYYNKLRGEVKEPYLTELVLSTERRTEIQQLLGIKESHFNTLLKALRDKGLFGENKNTLDDNLYPKEVLMFEFIKESPREEEIVKPQVVEPLKEVKKEVPIIDEEEKEIKNDNIIDSTEGFQLKPINVIIK